MPRSLQRDFILTPIGPLPSRPTATSTQARVTLIDGDFWLTIQKGIHLARVMPSLTSIVAVSQPHTLPSATLSPQHALIPERAQSKGLAC